MSGSRTVPASNDSAPLGVTIVGGLGILSAVLGLLGGIGLLGAGPGLLGGTLQIGLSAAQIVVLVNLLRLKRWAYQITLVVFGLDFLVSLLSGNLLGALLAAVIAGYLLTVGDAFE